MEIHTNNPHKENPKPEDKPTLKTSPQAKESFESHPEIPYTSYHKEFKSFRRITRAYARQIGELPTTPLLPRRSTVRPFVSTSEHTLVHN